MLLCPLVAGRIRIEDGEHYMIKMYNNGIPVTSIDNTDLNKSSLGSKVIVEFNENPFQLFFTVIQVANIFVDSQGKLLVRIKLTHLA